MTKQVQKVDYEALRAPFTDEQVSWRVTKQWDKLKKNRIDRLKCYADARAIKQRLDRVLGDPGWDMTSEVFRSEPSGVICTLSIWDGEQWVSRSGMADFVRSERGHENSISKATHTLAFRWAAGYWGIAVDTSAWPEVRAKRVGNAGHPDRPANAVDFPMQVKGRDDNLIEVLGWFEPPKISEIVEAL